MTLVCALVLAPLCGPGPAAHAASMAGGASAVAPTGQVDWVTAATDAEVNRAFAKARREKKPLLLYWGANWCPPCNQLKATLFNRQDFIDRSRRFVAVHVDGDLPGAQKLGGRFKVRGYPTMILFDPSGTEITRLPGEADSKQVMQVLQLGLSGGRPVRSVLLDVLGDRPVTDDEWRMLAYYGWDTDEEQLVPETERATMLMRLADRAPSSVPEARDRLLLKALAERGEKPGNKADAATIERVRSLLGDPLQARAQMDVLVNFAPELVRALVPRAGAEQASLAADFDAALTKLQADSSLSRTDHMSALIARIQLARVDLPKDTLDPKLPDPVLKQVREEVAKVDADITDGYERQAVIPAAAYLLGEAGLWQDSDALLKSNLQRSHAPYYLMSQLASNARKQGRADEALNWYEQAWARSVGPATRLQWGSSYLVALVDLRPDQSQRIEDLARQLFKEAAAQRGAFYERSARSLQRVGRKLAEWNEMGQHDPAIERLRAQLKPVCSKLPDNDPQRATCTNLLPAG